MQLTGAEIIERGIVYNHCPEGIQQQGVDVRMDKIRKVCPYKQTNGAVYESRKTQLPKYGEWLAPSSLLMPGYYEVLLKEAVKVPNNVTLHFKTRSSLVRCGAIVHSGQFDAGFETDQAGCFLQVLEPVLIETGARIAQAICFESAEVTNMYNGQWQGDTQRKMEEVPA